jgi:hypothetical protein
MSGGEYNYVQYRLQDVASDIEHLLERTDLSEETMRKIKIAANTVSAAAIMIQRVDYLVCGDDGEDSFNKRWNEELKDYKYEH